MFYHLSLKCANVHVPDVYATYCHTALVTCCVQPLLFQVKHIFSKAPQACHPLSWIERVASLLCLETTCNGGLKGITRFAVVTVEQLPAETITNRHLVRTAVHLLVSIHLFPITGAAIKKLRNNEEKCSKKCIARESQLEAGERGTSLDGCGVHSRSRTRIIQTNFS